MADLMPTEKPYYGSARPLIPPTEDLALVKRAASGCKACHLWRHTTQTVFGEGAVPARVMLVGEQPGDKEDIAGKPFVGPAGQLLDQCLVEAGIDPATKYTTNVVKHFKWVPKGPRRIHQKPNRLEMNACRPWLDAELEIVRPEALVLLGATAAQALLGADFRVSTQRGHVLDSNLAPIVIATVHPSSILRAPDDEARREARRLFIEDLMKVSDALRMKNAA